MRTPLAIAIGICVGAAAAGVVVFATSRPTVRVDEPRSAMPVDAPVAAIAPALVPDPPQPRTVPTTPDYGPRRPEPQAIYRCTTRSGTRYSNEPCAGGSVVDGSSAVSGYDTRPSDRLARLVAEGRVVDGPTRPVYRASPSVAVQGDGCATMRRQIVDLDAAMLRPNDPRWLDELRATRQDIRTSMARLRC